MENIIIQLMIIYKNNIIIIKIVKKIIIEY